MVVVFGNSGCCGSVSRIVIGRGVGDADECGCDRVDVAGGGLGCRAMRLSE